MFVGMDSDDMYMLLVLIMLLLGMGLVYKDD